MADPPRRRIIRVPSSDSPSQLASCGFGLVPLWGVIKVDGHLVCACDDPHDGTTKDLKRSNIGKHPIVDLAPHGAVSAIRVPARIRQIQREYPHANWGLVGGEVIDPKSGRRRWLVVIDLDSPGAEQALLELGILMADTFFVMTRNGHHLYYWSDFPVSNSHGLFRREGIDGLDVRGVNGYVLIADSMHYSGAIYTAVGDFSHIAPVPKQLVPYLVPYQEEGPGASAQDTADITNITTGLPLNELITADIQNTLDESPPGPRWDETGHKIQGERSEVAFKAILALCKLTDDDKQIYEVVIHSAIGLRYWEGNDLYRDIARARKWLTPASAADRKAKRQPALEAKLNRHWRAADQAVLPRSVKKLLLGFYRYVLDKGGFVAFSMDDWAIYSSVTKKTAIKYRDWVLANKWLKCDYKAEPGSPHASIYSLSYPRGYRSSDLGTDVHHSSRGCVCSVKLAAGGLGGAERPGSSADIQMRPSINRQNPTEIDVSADSCRWKASPTLWEKLLYLSVDISVSPGELGELLGVSDRSVRRYTKDLFELGLIDNRQNICLVADWEQRWEAIAVLRGAAGRKQAEQRKLAEVRQLRKQHRERQQIVSKRLGRWIDGRVVLYETGELV